MNDAAVVEPAPPRCRRDLWIALGLIAVTLAVFWPVGGFGFLNFDDDRDVFENPDVLGGFTFEAIKRTFTSTEGGYRQPLNWWSHLIDVELFGVNVGAHHLSNVVQHAIAALLLYWALKRLTKLTWPSAWAAAMFAIHPTHVESVAWIAERKDVLSVLFTAVTLIAYVRWVENRTPARYLLLMLAFAAALMSKPMMVTVPAVLLLLDLWPLHRLATPLAASSSASSAEEATASGVAKRFGRLVVEKLPLFAMSGIMSAIAIGDSRTIGTFAGTDDLSITLRLQTSIIAYARYLGKLVWPTDLVIIYPYPPSWPVGWVVASTVLVIAISALTVWQLKRRPYLLVGWLWFLGTLVPVIGIVLTGEASLADRYTYLPFIGLFIAIAWWAADWATTPGRRRTMAILGGATVLAAAAVAHYNVWFWRDSVTVMTHAIDHTKDNGVAHKQLGLALLQLGRDDEAGYHLEQAVRFQPGRRSPLRALANYLMDRGDPAAKQVIDQLAAGAKPLHPESLGTIGRYYAVRGDHAQAIAYYEQAVAANPQFWDVRNALAASLIQTGQLDRARAVLQETLAMNRLNAAAYHQLGLLAAREGRTAEARAMLNAAVTVKPNFGLAHLDYGVLLANLQQFDESLQSLQRAIDTLRPGEQSQRVLARMTMAQVLNHLGRSQEAAEQFSGAVQALRAQIAARPADPVPRYQLALVLQSADPNQALAAAEDAARVARTAGNTSLLAQLKARFPGLNVSGN